MSDTWYYPQSAQYNKLGAYQSIMKRERTSITKSNPDVYKVIQTVEGITENQSVARLDEIISHGIYVRTTGEGYHLEVQYIGYNSTHIEPTLKKYYEQYADVTKKSAAWKSQSRIAAGRRPTILTSGRGLRESSLTVKQKLKRKLGG